MYINKEQRYITLGGGGGGAWRPCIIYTMCKRGDAAQEPSGLRSMQQMGLAVWQATAPLRPGWKLHDEDLMLPVVLGW